MLNNEFRLEFNIFNISDMIGKINIISINASCNQIEVVGILEYFTVKSLSTIR